MGRVGEPRVHRCGAHRLHVRDLARCGTQRGPLLEATKGHAGDRLEHAQRVRAAAAEPAGELALIHAHHRVGRDLGDRPLRLEVATAVAEDDWVMGRCVVTATHTMAVMGVPPTGRAVETTFWDLHRFREDGLISQTWNLMDALTILQQLGRLPSP
jgi:predicted ester cyclase